MKKYLLPFIPQKLLDQYGQFKDSLKKIKFFFGGIYFTYFIKTYRVDGLEFIIPFELTDFLFRGRFVFDTYEKEERTYMSPRLKPDAVVLELGACIGVVSCLTNKLLNNKNQHVVVEANPNLIQPLEQNKQLNNSGFHIENCLISNEPESDFFIHDLIVGGSNLRPTAQKVRMVGKTIDQLEQQYHLQFDTLVMDIEGGELQLLREEKAKIKSFNQIFMEIHPFRNMLTQEEAEECHTILQDLGFKLLLSENNFLIWEK